MEGTPRSNSGKVGGMQPLSRRGRLRLVNGWGCNPWQEDVWEPNAAGEPQDGLFFCPLEFPDFRPLLPTLQLVKRWGVQPLSRGQAAPTRGGLEGATRVPSAGYSNWGGRPVYLLRRVRVRGARSGNNKSNKHVHVCIADTMPVHICALAQIMCAFKRPGTQA